MTTSDEPAQAALRELDRHFAAQLPLDLSDNKKLITGDNFKDVFRAGDGRASRAPAAERAMAQRPRSVHVSTDPKTEMNTDLHTVGTSFGVIKFVGGDADKPHWSDTGN